MCIEKIKSWFRKKNLTHTAVTYYSINIEEFVKASIIGIMSGIRGAQKEYQEHNSAYAPLISPAWGPPLSDLSAGTQGYADKIYDLEFDLAITVTESSFTKAGGKTGITVGVYTGNLKTSIESTDSSSTISRIRFSIPVRYPLAKLNKPDWNTNSIG